MSALLTFGGLFGRQAAELAANLALSLAAALAGVALLGVSGWFLTGAALTTAALSFNLFGPSALVRAFSFVRILARYGEKLVGHDATLKLLADIREWLFRRLIPRVPLASADLRLGDLVSRLVADVEALDTVFITAVGPGLTMVAVGAALGATLAVVLPPAAMVFLFGYGVAALAVPAALVAATRKAGRRQIEARTRMRVLALDAVEGHADILLFGRTNEILAEMAHASRDLSQADLWQNRAFACATATVAAVAGMTTLAVLAVGLETLHRGQLGGPALIGLVFAVLASFEVVAPVVRGAARLGAAMEAAERLDQLASAAPVTRPPLCPVPLRPGSSLRLDKVSFAHHPERPLLNGVTLDCPPGSRTAIVGESGCGKSTLLELALRLRDPDAGTVEIAGTDVSRVAEPELHARIALMSQATPVFLGTIRDNLRLGRPDADDGELRRVLGQVNLAEFVETLPEGLDTWCGEGGRTLSVGQARRLCLARTLLTGAAILLLDEPTSGLDRETEQTLLQDLAQATAGRTLVLVTHGVLPPGTVDRRFRLADGRLWPEPAE